MGDAPESQEKPLAGASSSVHKWRAIKTIAICAAICFCVHDINQTLIRLLVKPAWLTLAITLIGAFTIGAVPSVWVWRKFRGFIADRLGRIAKLEKKEDPSRSSSDLHPDGGHHSDE